MDDSRRYYRIHYPLGLRPWLTLQGVPMLVIDVSESGICFVAGPGAPREPGSAVDGLLRLHCRCVARLSGLVVRASSRDVAAILNHGVDYGIINREQRALRTRQRYSI